MADESGSPELDLDRLRTEVEAETAESDAEFDAWVIGRLDEDGADLDDVLAEVDAAYQHKMDRLKQDFARSDDVEAEIAQADDDLLAAWAADPERRNPETAEAVDTWRRRSTAKENELAEVTAEISRVVHEPPPLPRSRHVGPKLRRSIFLTRPRRLDRRLGCGRRPDAQASRSSARSGDSGSDSDDPEPPESPSRRRLAELDVAVPRGRGRP